jgi:hypothetical protein
VPPKDRTAGVPDLVGKNRGHQKVVHDELEARWLSKSEDAARGKLSEIAGSKLAVENRGGAGGIIGTEATDQALGI